jgi:hypothetical protein
VEGRGSPLDTALATDLSDERPAERLLDVALKFEQVLQTLGERGPEQSEVGESDGLVEQLLEGRRREWDVKRGRVVELARRRGWGRGERRTSAGRHVACRVHSWPTHRQADNDADESILLVCLERGRMEPAQVALLILHPHAGADAKCAEKIAAEQKEPFLLEPAGVDTLLRFEGSVSNLRERAGSRARGRTHLAGKLDPEGALEMVERARDLRERVLDQALAPDADRDERLNGPPAVKADV